MIYNKYVYALVENYYQRNSTEQLNRQLKTARHAARKYPKV